MNRWLNNPRIRRWASVEGGLLIVAVVLAAIAYVSSGPAGEAAEERTNVERRLAVARTDLADLRSGAVAAGLRQELQQLEATTPPAFPSLITALEFGTAVTEYAASQGLAVDAFDVATATYDVAGATQPAISYSFKAHGTVEALVGALSIPTRFPTSVIQGLELTPSEESGDWSLLLTLVVVHSGA